MPKIEFQMDVNPGTGQGPENTIPIEHANLTLEDAQKVGAVIDATLLSANAPAEPVTCRVLFDGQPVYEKTETIPGIARSAIQGQVGDSLQAALVRASAV